MRAVEVTWSGPLMVPGAKLQWNSAPGWMVDAVPPAPGRLIANWAGTVSTLTRWRLSAVMPGLVLSYQLEIRVAGAAGALRAGSSLKDCPYWARCEARIG